MVGDCARFLVRERDSEFTAPLDDILADAGIQVVLGGVRIPRTNTTTERWIHRSRRELLDRTLIRNQMHPQRVPPCRLTWTDDILGKHSAGAPRPFVDDLFAPEPKVTLPRNFAHRGARRFT
ncbi:hypothetical protein AB0G02_16635 [Actinosynnema sp. NPDC023658]|uniref:hypothetical protein n=1 Tax=Actinosynnema sp. NPDC023658 TaxID=3155465 RepID=UPI0033EEFF20